MIKILKLFLCSVLLLQQDWLTRLVDATPADQKTQLPVEVLNENNNRDISTNSASVLGSLYRKSRQSRCVRCYEDTRYGGDDRSRYSGGYASRSVDDRASSWYYPSSASTYDRYDDRSRGSEYDRYSSSYYRDRDDRYSPRTSYEGRGGSYYDDRRGSYDDRRGSYDDRRGSYEDRRSSYDRGGESRGSYDSRDRYYDRYYDRARQGPASSSYGNDRDRDYDRYYPRYDFRNYRPWDETYRGQSGFDNSGRGYYFATSEDNSRRYLPEERPRTQQSPCGVQVPNCPYGNTQGTSTTKVSSGPIDSGSQTGGGAPGYNTAINKNPGANNSGNGNSWNYVNEQDKNSRVDSRDRERDQQSSSYGGRPSRPLGGSYLFDRDSNNVIPDGQSNAAGAADSNQVSSDKSGKDTENSVAVSNDSQTHGGNKQ